MDCSLVDSVADCRTAVRALGREPMLAVDSEGIHLSRTGPLTLLQIATQTGRVYLFDILRMPRMFKDGGLQALLENESVVKVLHSARNDAQALYWQHGVELRNVHDTQVTHREVQRSEGQRFPPRAKLRDVCAVYCPSKASLVDTEKDVVTTKMNRTEGEYWAKRPLTQEMMEYAASDVITLIPEMYTAQIQLLERKGLTQTVKTRVERELRSVKEPDVDEAMKKEETELMVSTLKEFAASADRRQKFGDITDTNVVEALTSVRLDAVTGQGVPALVRDLKLQQMEHRLEEVEHEMVTKGRDYDGHGACRQLSAYVSVLEGHPLKERAQRVQDRINQIVLDDIRTKYTASTPVTHLAPYEKGILSRKLRPQGEHDPSVHPVLLRLYWKVKLEDLEAMTKKFRDDPANFRVSEGYAKLLRFYTSGNVPPRIKEMGRELLTVLQDMGKVARPAQRGGRRQEYGFSAGRWN